MTAELVKALAGECLEFDEAERLIDYLKTLDPETDEYTEGDDSHAGNRIPSVSTTWRVLGHCFAYDSGPDWDNYTEVWSLRIDDKLIAGED